MRSAEEIIAFIHGTGVSNGAELLDLTQASMDIIELGKLDWSTKKNWVEINGGLPKYIEKLAIGIMKSTG